MIGDLGILASSLRQKVHVVYTEGGEVKNKSGVLTSIQLNYIQVRIDKFSQIIIYYDRNCKITTVKNDKGDILYEVKPDPLCKSCENLANCKKDQVEVYTCSSYFWDKNSQ